MIVSFGYNQGTPPVADKVFDVRDLSHTLAHPNDKSRLLEITEYATAHPCQRIAIGCDEGKHRSRVLADLVGAKTKQSIYHRDLA